MPQHDATMLLSAMKANGSWREAIFRKEVYVPTAKGWEALARWREEVHTVEGAAVGVVAEPPLLPPIARTAAITTITATTAAKIIWVVFMGAHARAFLAIFHIILQRPDQVALSGLPRIHTKRRAAGGLLCAQAPCLEGAFKARPSAETAAVLAKPGSGVQPNLQPPRLSSSLRPGGRPARVI